MRLIHVVADYGPGDLAFSEMISALARNLPDDYQWQPTPVGSFDTLATGFIVAQLGLQDKALRAAETIIYANCAPRRDINEARGNNEGEGVLYGLLSNDVPILVVNSGYSLSFVRHELKELWTVKVDRGGSQFRSRDIFPPLVGKIAHGEFDFKDSQLKALEVIPERPIGVVAYIDSFGNLKTTYREGDKEIANLKRGQQIHVKINGTVRPARVATGSFNVVEGEIAFAAGSSGHQQRFWEIFRRGESAWATFGKPQVGAHVELIVD